MPGEGRFNINRVDWYRIQEPGPAKEKASNIQGDPTLQPNHSGLHDPSIRKGVLFEAQPRHIAIEATAQRERERSTGVLHQDPPPPS